MRGTALSVVPYTNRLEIFPEYRVIDMTCKQLLR